MNEEIKVTRDKKDRRYYVVSFVDGDNIRCKASLINKVAEQIPDTTPEEIAPLVVRVKSKATKFSTGRSAKMNITIDSIGETLGKLLGAYDYDYDRIREIIELLTVQEVEELFNSEDPVETLENF